MAHEQNHFLRHAALSWRKEFPFFKPIDLEEVPKVPKGCTYLCDAYASTRGRFYFISFDFNPRCRGEFSLGVTISPSPNRSVLDPAEAPKATPFTLGSFGIWQFLDKPWLAWALVDLEAEQRALFLQAGVEDPLSELGPRRHVWRPTSYAQPFEKIAEEALNDVNEKLRSKVFPVLQIDDRALT